MNLKIPAILMLIFLSAALSGCTLISNQPDTAIPADNADNTADAPKNTAEPQKDQNSQKPANEKNRLDLSGQNLDKIPEYVFGMKDLRELDISNNQLGGAIQAEIRHLGKLKILKASNNRMTGVPAEIGQLSDLEMLDLSNNQITGLPYELGNLKNLKTLILSGNDFSEADLKIIADKLPKNVEIKR